MAYDPKEHGYRPMPSGLGPPPKPPNEIVEGQKAQTQQIVAPIHGVRQSVDSQTEQLIATQTRIELAIQKLERARKIDWAILIVGAIGALTGLILIFRGD